MFFDTINVYISTSTLAPQQIWFIQGYIFLVHDFMNKRVT
jgi:hypothetical protein